MNRNRLSMEELSWEQEFSSSLGAPWIVANGGHESVTCFMRNQRPVLGMFCHWLGGGSVQSSTGNPPSSRRREGLEETAEVCVETRPKSSAVVQ